MRRHIRYDDDDEIISNTRPPETPQPEPEQNRPAPAIQSQTTSGQAQHAAESMTPSLLRAQPRKRKDRLMRSSYKSKRRYRRSDRSTSRSTASSNEQTENHREPPAKPPQQDVTVEIDRPPIQSVTQNAPDPTSQTKPPQPTQRQPERAAQTEEAALENEPFQPQRKMRNRRRYKSQTKITESDDEDDDVELPTNHPVPQSTQAASFTAGSSNPTSLVSAVNMMRLNSNTEETEFLFHDELTEESTTNPNAPIMVHRLGNFRRSSEFSEHIAPQKEFHSAPATPNNADIIDPALRLKQEPEYTIIQIPLAGPDPYEESDPPQSLRHEESSRPSQHEKSNSPQTSQSASHENDDQNLKPSQHISQEEKESAQPSEQTFQHEEKETRSLKL